MNIQNYQRFCCEQKGATILAHTHFSNIDGIPTKIGSSRTDLRMFSSTNEGVDLHKRRIQSFKLDFVSQTNRDVMWFAKQGEATRNWWQFWAIARLCCRRGVCFPNNQNMMGTAATRMTNLLTRAYGTMCTTCTICVPTQQERLDRDACGWRKQMFIIFWVCCLCNMTSKNIPNTWRDTPFWRLPEYWAGVLPVKRVPGTQCLFDHSWCQVLSAPGLEARRFPPGRRATAPVGPFTYTLE